MARETLSLGLCWHIGDGTSVRILSDPWVPLSGSLRVNSARDCLDPNDRVSILISEESHTWNRDAIHSLFSAWDAEIICSIPLPPRRKPDRLFWNATTTGLFSVRSAYFLLMQSKAEEVEGECSSVGRERKFWKYLWALSLPPTVKLFLWRACIGILPTHDLLWRRHMRIDDCCSCCLQAVESAGHALWSCPAANDVWLESHLKLHKWDRCIHNFCDLLMLVRERLEMEEVELFACLAYFIWDQRNKVIHEGAAPNPVGVVGRARSLLQSFKISLPQVGHSVRSDASQHGQGDDRVIWEAPQVGECKVNWEISKDTSSQVWYVGVLIRNHASSVMAGLCSPVMALPRGLNPRVGACIQALKFALDLGFFDICFEGPRVDFLDVMSSNQKESVADLWHEEVWVLIQRFHHFMVSPCTVKFNRATLGLAQLGSSFSSPKVWIEEVPSQILSLM